MKTNATNPPQYSIDPELIEKLAAIEHERWADWQRYLHSRLSATHTGQLVTRDGMLMTPEDYQHWEEQIAADYDELTEAEKQSDRDQVDRYLPLINQLIYTQVLELIGEDERHSHLTSACDRVHKSQWERNKLRAELRAKAKTKYIGASE